MPQLATAYAAAIAFAFGLCFGSFLNVIVYRLPRKESLVQPPSHCPACNKQLGFTELIPILGYIILRGRCRHCGIRISPRYPLVELATGLLFLLSFNYFKFSADFFFHLTLLFLLLAIAQIDLEHRIVPNRLVAAGIIAAIVFFLPVIINSWLPLPQWLRITKDPLHALSGMLVGGGIMLLIFLVSRGGMGAGDVKLMALIGLYVGLRGTALVFLLGFFFGAVVGLACIALGRLTRKDALPFAPYLSLATLVEIFWGNALWNFYLDIFR